MTITNQIKEAFYSFKHPATIELHTEDFERVCKQAEQDWEKSGLKIVVDNRYLEHSPHNQGRQLVWAFERIIIKEKINDSLDQK